MTGLKYRSANRGEFIVRDRHLSKAFSGARGPGGFIQSRLTVGLDVTAHLRCHAVVQANVAKVGDRDVGQKRQDARQGSLADCG